MKSRLGISLLALLVAILGCDPVPVQYPPGSINSPYPNPNNPNALQSQPQVSGSQVMSHAWNKAMEGAFLGLNIGGPFGGAGGFTLGLVMGLITAPSHYAELNAQIQSEHQKDRQLEAAIEQELERQRALESQIASASGTGPTTATHSGVQPTPAKSQPQSAMPQNHPQTQKPPDNIALASLSKPSAPPVQPTPFKNVEVRDINSDGVPDLWIYYNPQKPGEIIRQEEATKGDGRVDAWSYFKDGKLIRRDVDTKGLGRPDTVFYYEGDKIAREERDETGQGRMTYRAIYENGRLAKAEKDTSGRGRPDLWVYYDATKDGESVVKEERDINGDGIADLWSYYDNGRLVRRDVSAIGLELLSKQEQLPVAIPDLKHIPTPGG